MAKLTEYELACRRRYSAGYAAGSKRAWHEHKPPLPPDEILSAIISAAGELRDGVDSYLACLDEEDDLQQSLGSLVDKLDESLIKLTAWLTDASQHHPHRD